MTDAGPLPRQDQREPHAIVVAAFRDLWDYPRPAHEVVDIAFTALDEAGDTTVPRDEAARERADSMVEAVFTDLAHEENCDYDAVASNMLRGARSATPDETSTDS